MSDLERQPDKLAKPGMQPAIRAQLPDLRVEGSLPSADAVRPISPAAAAAITPLPGELRRPYLSPQATIGPTENNDNPTLSQHSEELAGDLPVAATGDRPPPPTPPDAPGAADEEPEDPTERAYQRALTEALAHPDPVMRLSEVSRTQTLHARAIQAGFPEAAQHHQGLLSGRLPTGELFAAITDDADVQGTTLREASGSWRVLSPAGTAHEGRYAVEVDNIDDTYILDASEFPNFGSSEETSLPEDIGPLAQALAGARIISYDPRDLRRYDDVTDPEAASIAIQGLRTVTGEIHEDASPEPALTEEGELRQTVRLPLLMGQQVEIVTTSSPVQTIMTGEEDVTEQLTFLDEQNNRLFEYRITQGTGIRFDFDDPARDPNQGYQVGADELADVHTMLYAALELFPTLNEDIAAQTPEFNTDLRAIQVQRVLREHQLLELGAEVNETTISDNIQNRFAELEREVGVIKTVTVDANGTTSVIGEEILDAELPYEGILMHYSPSPDTTITSFFIVIPTFDVIGHKREFKNPSAGEPLRDCSIREDDSMIVAIEYNGKKTPQIEVFQADLEGEYMPLGSIGGKEIPEE